MSNFKEFLKSYRFLQVLTGLLYLYMAFLAMRYSDENLMSSIRLIGVFSLLKGFFEIMNKKRISKRTNHKQYSALVLGCVDIVIGVILVINIQLDIVQIAILFGVWFISDAVISFFMLDLAKRISIVYYYISLVVDLVGGLIGLVLLIANNNSIVSTPLLISYFFLLFGFTKLIGGILNKSDLNSIN